MLTAGSVSLVSWYFPFLLGVVREFNFAAPFGTFLAAYAIVLVLSWVVIQGIGAIISAQAAPQRADLPNGQRIMPGEV